MRISQHELTPRFMPRVGSDVAFDITIPRNRRTPSGFTLVELMVVITIIGMLASMSLLVVGQVQRSARMSATQAKIARLDHIMTELYESYIYRRMPVSGSIRNPRNAAVMRLRMINDTMRMEMPTNWIEALSGPQISGLNDSPLRQVYERAFLDAGGTFERDDDRIAIIDSDIAINKTILTHEPAKLLYLIVMNAVPEAREMVGEKGIATDEAGLSYFVDAWGNPIYFLRWAPGFAGSDRQPDLWKWTGETPNNNDNVDYWNENISPDIFSDSEMAPDYKFKPEEWKKQNILDAIKKYPDPFDPVRARPSSTDTTAERPRPGFMLVPLIYSAGADQKWDIAVPEFGKYTGDDEDSTSSKPDQLVIDPFAQGYGAPFGNDGYQYDNIHNHTLGGR